jgi:hypothetical protein
MSKKKAIVTNWDRGITTSRRANSVEELNAGFAMMKNFDIYQDTKKAIPVPEFQNWGSELDRERGFKGLGSVGSDTFYATGKNRIGWYGDNWDYRVKITPDNFTVDYFIFDLSDMPATFWDNVQSDGEDIRVTNQDNEFRNIDRLMFDIDAETGYLIIQRNDADQFLYIYYGNATVSQIIETFNTGINRRNAYSNTDYIYTFADLTEKYPTDRKEVTTFLNQLNEGGVAGYGTQPSGFITYGLTQPVSGNTSYFNNDEEPTIPDDDSLTVSFLLRFTNLPVSNTEIIGDTMDAFTFRLNANGTISLSVDRESTSTVTLTSSTTLAINTTYLITGAFDDSIGGRLFVNGVSEDSFAGNGSDLDEIGGYLNFLLPENIFVDMVNYTDYRTESEILAHYNMISDVTSFWTVAGQESQPTTSSFGSGVALYQRAFEDTEWTEINSIIPIKNKEFTPEVSPIYATSESLVNFLIKPVNGLTILELAQYSSTGASIIDWDSLATVDFWAPTETRPVVTMVEGIDARNYYTNGVSDVNYITGSTFLGSAFDAFPTLHSIESWNGYIAMAGYRTNTFNSFLQIWNRSDTLATETIDLGLGQARVLGNIKGTLFTVVNNFIEDNQKAVKNPSMDIRIYEGGNSYKTTHRISVPTTMEDYTFENAWEQPVSNLRGRLKNAIIFYAKIPNYDGVGYAEGLWAVGKNEITDTFSLSLLYDTEGMGDVYNLATLTNQVVILHDRNRISRINPEPQYTNLSVFETRIFNDGNSDTEKELSGVEIMHENLESGQVITIYKKTEEDADWVEIFQSTETNSVSMESTVIMSSGDAMGKFKEIQFKGTSTGGKSAITQLAFTYETLQGNV